MGANSLPQYFKCLTHVVGCVDTQKVSWSAAHNVGVKASITSLDDLALISSEITASLTAVFFFSKKNFQVAPVTSEGDQRPDCELLGT